MVSRKKNKENIEMGEPEESVELLNQPPLQEEDKKRRARRVLNQMLQEEDKKRRARRVLNQMENEKEKQRKYKRFLNYMAQWNDFVLVGEKNKKVQQEDFIKKLKEKQIEVEEAELDGKIFYGLRASEEALKDSQCLSEEPGPSQSDDVESKCQAIRIGFVDSILNETKIDTGEGLEDLMENGVFDIKFCLYEENEKEKQRKYKRFLNYMAQRNDFVLVGEKDKKDQQEDFIKKLKEKQIIVKERELVGRIYYGLRATKRAIRIKIVDSILNETKTDKGESLEELMDKGVFKIKFSLYEENEKEKKSRAKHFLNEMAQCYDFVLVGEEDLKDQKEDFIKKLKKEKIGVYEKEKDGNIYYGLRANKELMNDKLCLPKDSYMSQSDDVESKRPATRIIIVESILNKTKTNTGDDLEDLMKKGVFKTKFSWYEEERKDTKKWAKRFLNEMVQFPLCMPMC